MYELQQNITFLIYWNKNCFKIENTLVLTILVYRTFNNFSVFRTLS